MFKRILSVALFMTFASVASAATFPVSNPGDFRNALTDAAANGENDVINVAECSGTGCSVIMGSSVYVIDTPLIYTADETETFGLTIDGFDSDTRILYGGASVPILRINAPAGIGQERFIVTGLTFVEGYDASINGGALYINTGGAREINVSASVFAENVADGDGGALYIRNEAGDVNIFDITFDGNYAGGDGGGAYIAASGTSSIDLSDIDFFDNNAELKGGGLLVEGLDADVPALEDVQDVLLEDILFSGNMTANGNGGGADIGAQQTQVRIVGFARNFAFGSGGGLYVRPNFTDLTMVNTGFVLNEATLDGGGFATGLGSDAVIIITNNTIYRNLSQSGPGGGALLTVDGSVGLAQIYNNIVYLNVSEGPGQDIFIDNDPNDTSPAFVEFFNNDITDLAGFPDSSTYFGITYSPALTFGNNIMGIPILPSILDLDPDPSQGALSPTIDAGDNDAPEVPSEDFEFESRPADGDGDMVATVDIGMDEFIGGALPSADLGVTWTYSPAPATGGENVTLSITVTNAGPDEATGVTVVAFLDERSTLDSALFNQGSPCTSLPITTPNQPFGTAVTCVLGAVAPSNNVPGTIEITTPVVETTTSLIAEVQVSGNEGDPDGQNNFDENVITLLAAEGPPMADLSISMMDSPDPVFSGGQDLTYTITVENAGPDPATGVTLSDTLPAGVTFVSASATAGQCDTTPDAGGVLNCSLDDLAVTSNTRVTIVVTPDIVTEQVTITNSATVTATIEDPTPGNNTAAEDTVVNAPSSDIGLATSSTPASPLIDDPITFTVTVSNEGPSDNSGVVVTIVLPPMTTFVSASIDQGSCGEANGVMMLTCTIGDLAAGASVNVQIIVTAPSETMTVTLSATVVADVEDPTPANNAVSEDVTVIDVVDLVIQGTSKGSGSVGWIELLFMLTVAGVMMARAGWTQLRSGSRVLMPALLCVLSGIVLMTANEVEAQENWYVGVSAGTTNLDYSAADLTSDLSSLGWTINNPKVDDSNTTWKVYAGFQVNDWFAVEAGYVDLGEVITQFGATIPPNEIMDLLSDTFSVHPYQGDGWMVAGVARYAFVPDQFSVVGRAGLFAWESKTTVRVISGGTGSVAGEDSGTDGMFGVGVEWQINEQWALTADWERYKLNEWLDVPSIGVKFSF